MNLPIDELRFRRRAGIVVPDEVPAAAKLTARELAGGHGITAALWAGGDRALTQRWAAALRRDGWWLLYAGVQHDPSGQLRMVAIFDQQGTHQPTLDGEWVHDTCTLHDDGGLHEQLASYGVTVREPGTLPWAFGDPATD